MSVELRWIEWFSTMLESGGCSEDPKERELIRRDLFRLIAESLRAASLTESEREVIAAMFDRLAVGDDPASVLFAKRGRGRAKRKATVRIVKGVATPTRPDDWTIAKAVHYYCQRGHSPAEASRRVQKELGCACTWKHIGRIYRNQRAALDLIEE